MKIIAQICVNIKAQHFYVSWEASINTEFDFIGINIYNAR